MKFLWNSFALCRGNFCIYYLLLKFLKLLLFRVLDFFFILIASFIKQLYDSMILWIFLMILWIFYNCRNLTEIRCLVVCLESKYLSIWINYWIQCWFWLIYKRNKVDKIPDIACYYRVNSTRSKSSTHCNSITLANPFQQFYCIEDLFRSLIKDWDFDLPNGKFSFSKI